MIKRRSILMPLFLLVLMLAGGGFHYWHHVLDPHCDAGTASESHHCLTCAALHGATAAEIGVQVAPPSASERDLRPALTHVAPSTAARGVASTRAPPQV
jgi:hypothetical protein